MPLYEYFCPVCKEEWESFHKIDARNSEKCPVCGKQAILKIGNRAKPVVLDYYCEMSDTYITGPKQKKRVLREKNLEER